MYNANIELKDYNPKQEVYMAKADVKPLLMNAMKLSIIVLNTIAIIKSSISPVTPTLKNL